VDKNMKKLNEIMIFYGTDKMESDHNYVSFYEEIFENKRNEKLKILEIGIYRPSLPEQQRKENEGRRLPGASLRTWNEYLPNSEIYGIDLHDFSDIENDKIKTFICNQESKEELNNLIEKIGSDFDVIIDDGGHTMKQHQVTISVLFKHLKPNGIYVIEDLHTCHIGSYVNGDEKTLDMLYDFQKEGKIKSKYITEDESNYLENNIGGLEVKMGRSSEIAIIYKK
jgi:hypothetical protein